MPGRVTTLIIVAFWLAMMGWLTGRELWKRYGPPPRLEDTLRAAADDGPTRWNISHKFDPLGWAETQVEALEDGRYQLRQHVHFDRAKHFFEILGLPVALFFPGAAEAQGDARMTYDLAPDGALQSFRVEILHAGRDVLARFDGKPEGQELQIRATSPLLPEASFDLKIPYDARNILHNSLCPLDRMPNLWPGRRWEAPMVDPARTMVSQMLQRAPIAVRVRDEPENFYWRGPRCWVACHVVDAEQAEQDLHLEIWVHEPDGLVLKQHVRWGKLTLDVERATVPAWFRTE